MRGAGGRAGGRAKGSRDGKGRGGRGTGVGRVWGRPCLRCPSGGRSSSHRTLSLPRLPAPLQLLLRGPGAGQRPPALVAPGEPVPGGQQEPGGRRGRWGPCQACCTEGHSGACARRAADARWVPPPAHHCGPQQGQRRRSCRPAALPTTHAPTHPPTRPRPSNRTTTPPSSGCWRSGCAARAGARCASRWWASCAAWWTPPSRTPCGARSSSAAGRRRWRRAWCRSSRTRRRACRGRACCGTC